MKKSWQFASMMGSILAFIGGIGDWVKGKWLNKRSPGEIFLDTSYVGSSSHSSKLHHAQGFRLVAKRSRRIQKESRRINRGLKREAVNQI